MEASKIKALTPIIISLIALAGTILTAVINSDNADADDVKASTSSVVTQLNDKTIPFMQSQFDKLDTKFDDLNIRISRLEGKIDQRAAYMMSGHKDADTLKYMSKPASTDFPKTKPSIPKLKMAE